MRLVEPLTLDIIVRLGVFENSGSFRVEWNIAGCWRSRHDTIVEHDGSRRTDVPQAYVVLLLQRRNYRLRIEWTTVMISLSRPISRQFSHSHGMGIPEFKPEDAYRTATQTGTSSAIIFARSTVEYSILIRSDPKCLELGCWNRQRLESGWCSDPSDRWLKEHERLHITSQVRWG